MIGNCPERSSRSRLPADRSGKRPIGEACGPDTSRTPEVNKCGCRYELRFQFRRDDHAVCAHVWACANVTEGSDRQEGDHGQGAPPARYSRS